MAKKGKQAYEVVFLACSETGDRNYTILKKTRGAKKQELKKYCPKLRKHTVHNEKKK
jgi:large subunit ribosomal protein L33